MHGTFVRVRLRFCPGLLSATGALAALDVSMSVAPTYANPIFPGDVSAFRITLTNSNSASNVTAVAFTNYYSARCSARDLARFGLFAQRGGRWAGRHAGQPAYLCAAKAPSQELNPAYGYLWWNNANPGDGAGVGAGGQVVMIVPFLDLVVVRQGLNPGGGLRSRQSLSVGDQAARRRDSMTAA